MSKINRFYYTNYSKQLMLFAFVFLLFSCSTRPNSLNDLSNIALAEQSPIQHFEQEMMITRLSQMIVSEKQISLSELAALYFERGILYDSLGLWEMARQDFLQAIELQPKYIAAHNYLGLYSLIDGNYSEAIAIFNSMLKIEPTYEYAHFNRGLSFYYAGHYDLAEQDLLTFYHANPTDPYRTLWLYLNELQYRPDEAKDKLAQRIATLDSTLWGTTLVHYYLQEFEYDQLLSQIKQLITSTADSPQYAEILTETYFYLAKQQLNLGNVKQATMLFKLALANQVFNFVEYRFALLELLRIHANDISEKSVVTDTP